MVYAFNFFVSEHNVLWHTVLVLYTRVPICATHSSLPAYIIIILYIRVCVYFIRTCASRGVHGHADTALDEFPGQVLIRTS